ncbi:MAG: DUF3794 domain-containing protein [Oscillospiraceae bacterium]|nr:DUF3794 domain-containing protein [Oscillospiraceae bacterium]
MNMELRRVTLEGYRPVAHTMFSQEETLESIVPDAFPDIARVVSASGKAFLKDKELGEGALRLSGTAKVSVLYIPEGEELPRSLEVSIPFQCQRDDPRFRAGCPVLADVQAATADARTVNPRKLLARVNITVWAAAYDRERRELSADLTVGEGEGLQKLITPRKCCVIPDVVEKSFTFSDVLRPPASRPELEELLSYRAELGTADAKFIGKKLVLKGDVQLSAVYRSGEGVCQTRFELPYSQILDIGELPDEAEPEVAVTLKSVDCRTREGELEVALEVLAQAAVWERRSVSLIGDAYCVGEPIDVERTTVRLCTMAERSSRREMGRKLCESGIPAKQVLDCAAAVSSLAGAPAEGGMEFTAQVNASILYLSEDDALCGVETEIPVTCRVDVPEGCQCACRCRPVGECTAVPVTGGLEVRFEAEFVWTVTREEQVSCVSDVKPGEVRDTGPRPSVVIRRVERGEALWDIAKSCGSTVDDIRAANTLPGDEAAAGTLLLIPARRS